MQTNTPLTRPPIERFQELAEKATSGPWKLDPHYQMYVWGPQSQMIADDGQDEEGTLTRMRGVGANLPLKDNGEFIAAARTAIPELCKYALALERSLKACRSVLESVAKTHPSVLTRKRAALALESKVREMENGK